MRTKLQICKLCSFIMQIYTNPPPAFPYTKLMTNSSSSINFNSCQCTVLSIYIFGIFYRSHLKCLHIQSKDWTISKIILLPVHLILSVHKSYLNLPLGDEISCSWVYSYSYYVQYGSDSKLSIILVRAEVIMYVYWNNFCKT